MLEIDVRDAYLMCSCSSDDANPYITQIYLDAYSSVDANSKIDHVNI